MAEYPECRPAVSPVRKCWPGEKRCARLLLCGAAILLSGCTTGHDADTLRVDFSASQSNESDIIAEFRGLAPSGTLTFRLSSPGLRKATWKPLGSATQTDDTTYAPSAGQPVAFAIAPDPVERDRVYPGLVSIDAARILNLDYLMLLEPAQQASLQSGEFRFLENGCQPASSVRLDLDQDRQDQHRGRYVVLDRNSSLACRSGGNHTLITDRDTPSWLADHLSGTLTAQLGVLSGRLGRPAGDTPRLIVAYDPDPGKPPQYRGEAGWRNTLFVRFQGTAWDTPDPLAASSMAHFVTHEAVHLWIGQGPRVASDNGTSMLTEGAAEYLAFLSVNDNPLPAAPLVLQEAEMRISACNRSIEDRPLKRLRLSGRTYYDCGFVLQWLTDLDTSRDRAGGIWRTWQGLLGASEGEISLTSFLEASASSHAARWFTAPTAQDRINVVSEAAAGGFHVSQIGAFPASELTGFVVQHILSQHCPGGSYGFYTLDHAIRLDSGQGCGPLSGDPIVETINGRHVLNQTSELLEDVQKVCLAGGLLRFADDRGRSVASVTCRMPLRLPTLPVRIAPDSD